MEALIRIKYLGYPQSTIPNITMILLENTTTNCTIWNRVKYFFHHRYFFIDGPNAKESTIILLYDSEGNFLALLTDLTILLFK